MVKLTYKNTRMKRKVIKMSDIEDVKKRMDEMKKEMDEVFKKYGVESITDWLIKLDERVAKLEGLPQEKIKITKESITDLILELKSEGFFKEPRTAKEIVDILASKGRHYPPNSLTWPLQHAVRTRMLGRLKKEKKWAYVAR
jgi:hypothetical protein